MRPRGSRPSSRGTTRTGRCRTTGRSRTFCVVQLQQRGRERTSELISTQTQNFPSTFPLLFIFIILCSHVTQHASPAAISSSPPDPCTRPPPSARALSCTSLRRPLPGNAENRTRAGRRAGEGSKGGGGGGGKWAKERTQESSRSFCGRPATSRCVSCCPLPPLPALGVPPHPPHPRAGSPLLKMRRALASPPVPLREVPSG